MTFMLYAFVILLWYNWWWQIAASDPYLSSKKLLTPCQHVFYFLRPFLESSIPPPSSCVYLLGHYSWPFFLPTVYLPRADSSPALVQQSTHLFLSTISSRRPLSFLLLGVSLPGISNDFCYYRA